MGGLSRGFGHSAVAALGFVLVVYAFAASSRAAGAAAKIVLPSVGLHRRPH